MDLQGKAFAEELTLLHTPLTGSSSLEQTEQEQGALFDTQKNTRINM